MSGRGRDRIRFDPSGILKSHPRDLAIRFGFGALVAVLATLIGRRLGPLVGGVFLAFPAILPASLTLIEKRQSEEKAGADAAGGILGAAGMLAFALTLLLLVRPMGLSALAVALGAWVAVAGGLYLTLRRVWPRVWGEDGGPPNPRRPRSRTSR